MSDRPTVRVKVRGLGLALASVGLADGTIRGDVGHLGQMRAWFGRPLCGSAVRA
ncbi:hypothetical protein GCM10027168_13090 [Streptomyces capparidis]